MAKSMIFGLLLADGIYRVSHCEAGKPVSVIHDELGYALGREGGSALYYWRRGNLPNLTAIETLARELMRRSDLDEEWLRSFLESASHPYVDGFCAELFPAKGATDGVMEIGREGGEEGCEAVWSERMPKPVLGALVGRMAQVENALRNLAGAAGRWAVAIDGIGGIGKTALALEIATTALKRRIFGVVVWVDVARCVDGAGCQFEAILDEVIWQLGSEKEKAEAGFKAEAKAEGVGVKMGRVRSLLAARRVLVVIDGLEVVQDVQARVVRRLEEVLGQSQALLVSRYRFKGSVYTIHLGGLDSADAIALMRQEAQARRLCRVGSATDEELGEIAGLTGGSPLAMKLVVRELEHLPMEVVLRHLCAARPVEDDWEGDEYFYLYSTIYGEAWQRLSAAGRQLLVAMIQQGADRDVSLEMLRQVAGGLSEDDLTRCIHELWRLSLMETAAPVVDGVAGLRPIRYELHALTRYFVPAASRLVGP